MPTPPLPMPPKPKKRKPSHPKKDGVKLQCYCGVSKNIKIALPPGETTASKKVICQNCDNIYLVTNDNYGYSITTHNIKTTQREVPPTHGSDQSNKAREQYMTSHEREVLARLTQAWNKFVDLPRYHSDEIFEFKISFHRLQDLIGNRVLVRLGLFADHRR